MNGQGFIIFTTEQGGYFAWRAKSREEYDAAVRDGVIHNDVSEETYRLKFVAYGTIEANHDFILRRSRDAAPE